MRRGSNGVLQISDRGQTPTSQERGQRTLVLSSSGDASGIGASHGMQRGQAATRDLRSANASIVVASSGIETTARDAFFTSTTVANIGLANRTLRVDNHEHMQMPHAWSPSFKFLITGNRSGLERFHQPDSQTSEPRHAQVGMNIPLAVSPSGGAVTMLEVAGTGAGAVQLANSIGERTKETGGSRLRLLCLALFVCIIACLSTLLCVRRSNALRLPGTVSRRAMGAASRRSIRNSLERSNLTSPPRKSILTSSATKAKPYRERRARSQGSEERSTRSFSAGSPQRGVSDVNLDTSGGRPARSRSPMDRQVPDPSNL